MAKLLFLFWITLCLLNSTYCYQCNIDEKQCEIWLNIDEKLTMHWNKIRVYAKNGQLYKFDEHWENATTKIPTDEVIVMDGVERTVVAANNSVPGPPIIAYEGQEMIIHVKNNLLSESVTIHWHGLHQKGTPFMDGVAYVTQCPINAGQSFKYKFYAKPKGTFWYHSHVGNQRVDGLFGAFIIKPKSQENEMYKNAKDMIMHVGDWFHSRGSQLHVKMISANFKSQPGFMQPKTLDGVYFSPLIYDSAHIEGIGSYFDKETGQWTETPKKTYIVESGKQYRFRVINTGTIFPLRVSVDSHLLTVISSDGYDVLPTLFESFILNPGERYDFILEANQSKGDYWMRVDSMEDNFSNHYVRGILRYDAKSVAIPSTKRITCTKSNPCRVLNCQFKYFPDDTNATCVSFGELRAKSGEKNPSFEKDSIQLFQNWVQIPGGMGVNGKLFAHPSVNSLTQPEEMRMELNCNKADCGDEKTCSCQHEIELPFNKTVQMIWTNHGKGAARHHPIHLHGHSFHVLKIGYGSYNTTSGIKLSDNKDINCATTKLCNNPSFSNKTWYGNDIPGLNLIDPPQKDTLMIPTGAYAVIRFQTNNPGKWFIHCHIGFHLMQGMALILNEAKEHHMKPPRGFPICSDFKHDNNLEKYYVRGDLVRYEDCSNNSEEYYTAILVLVIVLAVVFVVENSILIIMYFVAGKYRKPKNIKSKNVDLNTAKGNPAFEVENSKPEY